MNNNEVGINEAGLRKVGIEIMDYAEKVKRGFNDIEKVFDDSLLTFKGSDKMFLKNYFDAIKTNFKIINQNLILYSRDMSYVALQYKKLDQKSGDIVRKEARKLIAKADDAKKEFKKMN